MGITLEPVGSLFPRINIAVKSEGRTKEKKMDDSIDIDIFKKIDLRIGRIVSAEKVKGSKKLYRVLVDIGKEKRTIIAGVADSYTPEELEGMEIVVVANLKPATIMGEESNGMLLAASKGKKLSILSVDREIEPGSSVS